VPYNSLRTQAWIGSEQSLSDLSKLQILSIRVGCFVRTLKFYAEGKIVTTVSTLIPGLTCMPSSPVKRYKLNRFT